MLDTIRHVQTPEGIALHLPAAGPVPRALAWLLDAAIRLGLLLPVSMLAGMMSEFGMGMLLLWMFLLMWGYPILFEVLWDGQSPGKRALGLRVVAADGAPVGWLASTVRNLMRTVDMLPLGYATGITSSLLDRWGRRIGDMVAGTLVIHVANEARTPATTASAAGTGTGTLASPVPLQPQEQAALVAFADRADELSAERRQELAALVPALAAPGQRPSASRLRAIGDGLLGR